MKKFLFAAVCALLLALPFFRIEQTTTDQPVSNVTQQESLIQETPSLVPKEDATIPPISAETPKREAPVPSEAKDMVKESKPEVSENENPATVCTFSIRCDTILENMEFLDESKVSLVPPDGVILAETSVPFNEGESVFDLLLRETRNRSLHLDFEITPIYNTAYIKGIANLYERDCGNGSGWLYRINGEIPNHGCSQQILQAGDVVEWIYSCNFGDDVD